MRSRDLGSPGCPGGARSGANHDDLPLTSRQFPLLTGNAPLASACDAFAVAWDHASEECERLERAARAALAEPQVSFGPAGEELFDLVAASDLLPRTVPTGRIPKDFAARSLEAARSQRRALAAEAAALRAARAILKRPRPDGIPAATKARLVRLAKTYPGEPEEGLAPGELSLPGTPLILTRTGAVYSRENLPDSAIFVGPPLVSRRFGLIAPRASDRAARRRSQLAARQLGRALQVVDAAWPEAGAEIRDRTRLILPLDEPGLVSYSLVHRPGVTFINLRRKSLLDLADDLLHETAHHRLHAIEHVTPLFPRRRAMGDEVRYWSPWRRAQRPVRGIYHAAYTFAFRAELFRRIGGLLQSEGKAGPLRITPLLIRQIRRESQRERRLVARAVTDLRDASNRGLVTAPGRRLLDRISHSSEFAI